MTDKSACFPVTGGDTLNQITKVRFRDGREVAIVDWSWRPLYSAVDTLSGWTDQALRMFQYGLGDDVLWTQNLVTAFTVRRAARLDDTNIQTPGQMDSTQESLVYGMAVEMYDLTSNAQAGTIQPTLAGQPQCVGANIAILHLYTILELEVAEKAYQQASVGWFSAGFGVWQTLDSIAAVGTGRSYASNGFPGKDAIDLFPVPVHIPMTNTFAAILHNPQGAAISYVDDDGQLVATKVMRLRCSLIGLHKRPAG